MKKSKEMESSLYDNKKPSCCFKFFCYCKHKKQEALKRKRTRSEDSAERKAAKKKKEREFDIDSYYGSVFNKPKWW